MVVMTVRVGLASSGRRCRRSLLLGRAVAHGACGSWADKVSSTTELRKDTGEVVKVGRDGRKKWVR